jgi:hypothetical protein
MPSHRPLASGDDQTDAAPGHPVTQAPARLGNVGCRVNTYATANRSAASSATAASSPRTSCPAWEQSRSVTAGQQRPAQPIIWKEKPMLPRNASPASRERRLIREGMSRKFLLPVGRPAEVIEAPVPVPGPGQLPVCTEAVGVGVGLVRMLKAGGVVRPRAGQPNPARPGHLTPHRAMAPARPLTSYQVLESWMPLEVSHLDALAPGHRPGHRPGESFKKWATSSAKARTAGDFPAVSQARAVRDCGNPATGTPAMAG